MNTSSIASNLNLARRTVMGRQSPRVGGASFRILRREVMPMRGLNGFHEFFHRVLATMPAALSIIDRAVAL